MAGHRCLLNSFARKLFSKHGWLVIDVTRRSIEETAATILTHYARHKEQGHDARGVG